MTQIAQVFLLSDGQLLITTLSTTTAGVAVADGEPKKMPGTATPTEKGAAVTEALLRSRQGIRHPSQSEWKHVSEPILRAVGARSWAAFAKKVLCCDVAMDNMGGMEITPYVAEGTRGAFSPLNDKRVVLKRGTSLELMGEALMGAFETARNREGLS